MTKAKPVKQLTEAEKIQERIERYEVQAAEIRAKAARLKARISEAERKKETQKKIILGAAIQSYLAKASDVDGDKMRAILVANLSLADAKKVDLISDPLGLLDT